MLCFVSLRSDHHPTIVIAFIVLLYLNSSSLHVLSWLHLDLPHSRLGCGLVLYFNSYIICFPAKSQQYELQSWLLLPSKAAEHLSYNLRPDLYKANRDQFRVGSLSGEWEITILTVLITALLIHLFRLTLWRVFEYSWLFNWISWIGVGVTKSICIVDYIHLSKLS